MRLRHAVIGMFVTTALIFIASEMPARPAFIDTANFVNNSDAPVLFYITKVTDIGEETVCLDPGDSDSSHFIQKVRGVTIFFRAGDVCRYPNRKDPRTYSFYEPETTYTIRGVHGRYSVSVHH